ncbi:MAG: NAD(P)-dependent oxidoreductase [Vicingus serpentipes]|nr:NAD(P)-dependent oxidoreductase [Vicingus serpentipes]
MHIVVVGLGLIGNNIRKNFLKRGHDVTTISRNNGDLNIDLSRLIDKEVVTDKFIGENIDAIIFTAFKIPKSPDDDGVDLLKENIDITINFLIICQLIQPKQIINLSSIAVYKNQSGVITEKSEISPSCNWNCYYGLSKLNAEEMISNYGNKENVKTVHLRISQMLDEQHQDSLQKSFKEEILLKNSITLYANGIREANFIYSDFLSNSILINVVSKGIEGVYNVGQFQSSYLNFAKKFVSENGNNETKINLVEKGNTSKIEYDCSKIQAVIS